MEKAQHQDRIQLTNKHLQTTGKRYSEKDKTMSYADAMRILDRVREGVNYPTHIVTIALRMTGDLDE